MTEELEQLLHNLRLHTVAERFDAHLAQAEADGLPVAKLFVALLRDEWHARQEQALKRRLQRARLPEIWTIESFPFKQQTGVDRRRIRTLAELDFVPKAENIVFIGPTGVGKTGLASGLLLKALQNGYRGLFVRAQDLFDEMYASLADRSSRKLLNRLARLDVVVVDEMADPRDEHLREAPVFALASFFVPILDAAVDYARSSFTAERQRANTASPMRVRGMPCCRASMAVHLPVPFWPAVSRIFSTIGSPSSSLKPRMSRVISIRYESSSPSFQPAKTAPRADARSEPGPDRRPGTGAAKWPGSGMSVSHTTPHLSGEM